MSSGETVADAQPSDDRLVVRLDAGGPIELIGLTDSLSALSRIYERHYRPPGQLSPKLYVTRLETGSVIAEIAPLAMLLGEALPAIEASMKIGDFAARLSKAIRAFSGVPEASTSTSVSPTRDDARDLREFIKPITGRGCGGLGIKHARFAKRSGETEIIVEYVFDEGELNRAAVNMDQMLGEPELPPIPPPETESAGIVREVMLFFDQTSRAPGKEQGRTSDKAVVPEVSDKPLPVHFRRSINDLKARMAREQHPLTNAFVVDVHVQRLGGEPKGYIVTELHKVIPSEA